MSYDNYADETHIYLSGESLNRRGWMDACIQNDFLLLDSDKTEIIVCGQQKQRENAISHLCHVSLFVYVSGPAGVEGVPSSGAPVTNWLSDYSALLTTLVSKYV